MARQSIPKSSGCPDIAGTGEIVSNRAAQANIRARHVLLRSMGDPEADDPLLKSPGRLPRSKTGSSVFGCSCRLFTQEVQEDDMEPENQELDRLQAKYKAVVEEWIIAIRHEEALASGNHEIAEVDQWEAAHFAEDEVRSKVKAAKTEYEGGLRKKFFNI
jgi:hypothetical protein